MSGIRRGLSGALCAALVAALIPVVAGQSAVQASATTVPARTYTLKFVTVNAPGAPSPLTTNNAALSHTANLNAFYQRINGSAVTFVYGGQTTFNKPTKVDCDASGAGVFDGLPEPVKDPNTYDTITVYAAGATLNCLPYAGKAGVGGGYRRAVMFDSLTNDTAQNFTLVHEVGHTLVLGHSSGLACNAGGTTTTGAFDLRGASCSAREYLGPHSVMGKDGNDTGGPYNLGVNSMLYLGGLTHDDIYTANSSSTQTYSITGLLSGTGKLGIIIPSTLAPWTIEYRPATGTESANASISNGFGPYPGAGIVLRRLGAENEHGATNTYRRFDRDYQIFPTSSASDLYRKPAVFHHGASITLPDGTGISVGAQNGTTAAVTITRPVDRTAPTGSVSAYPDGLRLGESTEMNVELSDINDDRTNVSVTCTNNGSTVFRAEQVLFAYEPSGSWIHDDRPHSMRCTVPVVAGVNRVVITGTDGSGNIGVLMDRTYTRNSLPGEPPPLNPDTPSQTLRATLSKNTRKRITVTVTGKRIPAGMNCQIRTRANTKAKWKVRTTWPWAGTKRATVTIKKGYLQARCGSTGSTTKAFS